MASPKTAARSLMQQLIPVVDCIRDLYTQLGARAYKVSVVRTRWSSGRRGVGTESVVSSIDLLPTPLVVDMAGLNEVLTAIGTNEQGQVTVKEISGRYTEDQLLGVDAAGNPPGPGDNLYYEIEFFRGSGQSEIRRFVKQSAPNYSPGDFAWSINLVNANENRNRDGSPRG